MEAVDSDLSVRIEDPDSSANVQLTCSVAAHPIPSISWTRDGSAVSGTQSITGFRYGRERGGGGGGGGGGRVEEGREGGTVRSVGRMDRGQRRSSCMYT